MDAEEITKLCKSLSLMMEDGDVAIIERSLAEIGERQVRNCLVGKVLANKIVNKDAFRAVLQQFHNVPISCMNKEIGLFLGAQIGNVEDIDRGINGDCLGRFLHLRINIDITKPLKRCLRVQLRDNVEVVTLLIQYERLPEFCYKYSKIGHIYRECLVFDSGRLQSNTRQQLIYGLWLRASIPTAKG
ncbi:Zinc knuckle CX2CX4HX4C [Melia azedarach]|uniref:Zinc knuckle CX2CX4HX4C n=1 Tax=Melia azedarach TaxID=155640 RepID=A0ACC1XNY3_MELAZ|nr:Zinc knuckle CX2CX4HX4C [Melia azedarach]